MVEGDAPVDVERINWDRQIDFCADIFQACRMPRPKALEQSKVPVASDARGIPSQGIPRLTPCVAGLKTGQMLLDAEPLTTCESPTSILLDPQGGLGVLVSLKAMVVVVTRGKIEVYDRLNKTLPPWWAVDKEGSQALDPKSFLSDMFYRKGGGISTMRIDLSQDPSCFKAKMDRRLGSLRGSVPGVGASRVYFAGLKKMGTAKGVPIPLGKA